MMLSLPARSRSVSSESPRLPRSACEIALARDAGQARELGLAQVTVERGARAVRPRAGRRPGAASSTGQPALELVAEDAALDAGRPALGLRDPQPPVADVEHALGDPLDLTAQHRRVAGGGERPVGDRAEAEQQRAAAGEEGARGLAAPALAHRLERVEEEQLSRLARATAGDRVEQRTRLRERRRPPGHRRPRAAGRAPRSSAGHARARRRRRRRSSALSPRPRR